MRILTFRGEPLSILKYSWHVPAIELGSVKKQVASLPHSFLWKQTDPRILIATHFPKLQYYRGSQSEDDEHILPRPTPMHFPSVPHL